MGLELMSLAAQYFPQLDEVPLKDCVDGWKTDFPDMGVLALLPEPEKDAVPHLQNIFSNFDVPVIGGIFPELIVDGKFRRSGCWLLRFDEAPFYILQGNLPRDPDGVVRTADEVSAQIRDQIQDADSEMTLFLLFDAMVPNIATLLDELYLKLANRLHYAGANAGSETFQPMPCLFDNERIVSDGMLAVLIRPHHGAILEHGYRLPKHSYTATATDGNRISHIDWKPAFDVYCELVRKQYGVEITRDNFYEYAVHFPFGIVRANHNVLVRIPVALGDDGSLFCVGEVPPHSVLTLLQAPDAGSHHTVDTLVLHLSELNGGVAGRDLLLFYCAGRRMHFGAASAEDEMHDMLQRSNATQLIGALSLGEIGASSIMGYPLFHNATLVTALW
jgi:hypothetical protein